MSRDTLARLDELGQALTEIAAQLAEIRQAYGPAPQRRRAISRRGGGGTPRPGDRFLKSVKVVAFGLAFLGVVLAMLTPLRAHQLRYSPRCVTACARPVVHQAGRRAG